jgi:hypothetical protein
VSEEQQIIVNLNRLLGLALGALETVRLCPYDFNQDGVARVIKEIRQAFEPVIVVGDIDLSKFKPPRERP